MEDYIKRLTKCGYSRKKALCLCRELLRNLPIYELEFFVEHMERVKNVG